MNKNTPQLPPVPLGLKDKESYLKIYMNYVNSFSQLHRPEQHMVQMNELTNWMLGTLENYYNAGRSEGFIEGFSQGILKSKIKPIE